MNSEEINKKIKEAEDALFKSLHPSWEKSVYRRFFRDGADAMRKILIDDPINKLNAEFEERKFDALNP